MAKQEQVQPFRSIVLQPIFLRQFGLQDDMQRYWHNTTKLSWSWFTPSPFNSRL
jgi:hypothetical protein